MTESKPDPTAAAQRELDALVAGEFWNPHGLLGAHPAQRGGARGAVVRAFHPGAVRVECVTHKTGAVEMPQVHAGGVFEAFIPQAQAPLAYTLRLHFRDGHVWEHDDPYRFPPTLGATDLHLINEGTHRRLWEALGARPMEHEGVSGVAFSVWAPNARRVSVVGDFCRWDGRLFAMRQLGSSGVWEIFIPRIHPGMLYKYEIKTHDGKIRIKADPLALAAETPPQTASRVYASDYQWNDDVWMDARSARRYHNEPMAIYEVHLGSWAHVLEEGHRALSYREIAPRLVAHVKRFGFNFIELMPVAEHPFSGSWGYQVSGYYAPTSRFGTPDDFRCFVDYCHQHGVGVIVDWVPAHFPKDDFALARFDGTALYEHDDERLGEHPDWGTLIFNYGRNEVRNFLVANALFWCRELHVDGLRVDAVASMIYLDYSRKPGEWIPNRYGGNENLEAIAFVRELNAVLAEECPGCFTVAEESTAYAGVSRPVSEGGLGFTFKWNMGWMHDTLRYFSKDPIHRRYHQFDLSFAMVYEYHERFIMPLSHDEVVHGKRALLDKMPGDVWQKFANLRLLLTYQWTRPGKKLLFMGSELAPWQEWNYQASLDWHLAEDPLRRALQVLLEDLGRLYQENACLWRLDHEPAGFRWISYDDADNSVLAYMRCVADQFLIIVLNLTPVPRHDYRIGVPTRRALREWLNTDAPRYAGSGYATLDRPQIEDVPMHGCPHSVALTLPPLGALVLGPAD